MFLIYTPEGQEEQRWLYQPGRLKTAEMIAIERRTGLKYGGEFKQVLMQGGTLARKALLWTFLRRTHHTISFDDVDFYDDELKLVLDREELQAEIAGLQEFDGVTEAERESGLALLRMQLAEAPYPPGKDPRPVEEKLAEVRDLGENLVASPPDPYYGDEPQPRFVPVMPEPAVPAGAAGPSMTSSTPEPIATWPTLPTLEPLPGPDPSRL